LKPPLPVIVYCGPSEALEALRAELVPRAELVVVQPEPSQVNEALRSAEAYLDASMKVRITRSVIAAAPALRVVAVAATGADHVDAAALRDRSIPLITLRGETNVLRELTPAAEHSWLLLMACARQLAAAREHVLQGQWNRLEFPGIMLKGKALGIVGCGRIGSWMGRYATAFGMRVLGYDPALTTWPAYIESVPLDDLLRQADFVTLHVPLTESTVGLFDRSRFERLKRGAIFINTSRGDLIDEAALLDGLRTGRIGAAGLDVLRGEPDIVTHPLWQYARSHANLLITPHIGGFSPDAVRVVVAHSARRILEHLGRAAGS
jgi:D-3-phosphoglycerate dehydrogenase